jgi:predicted nucleotidyltransferase
MVTPEQILDLNDQLVRQFRPKRVILFGSYAFGQPNDDSDVDLLVILGFAGEGFRKAAQIRSSLPAHFPIDLLVRTPATLRRRLKQNDFFLKEVIEKGIVLYDATDSGMGRKGRRRLQRRALALASA